MRIAAFTMAYNEAIFLPIWYNYYGKNVGFENLYVLDHGSTDGSTEIFHADRRFHLSRGKLDEVEREIIVSDFQAGLLKKYDVVIFSDADEILVPRSGSASDLREFIRKTPDDVIRAAGVNLIQLNDEDAPIHLEKEILGQRQILEILPPYAKTLITRVPVRWKPGFHTATPSVPIDPDLILIHLKNMDRTCALKNQEKHIDLEFSERALKARHGSQFLLSPEQYLNKNFIHTRERLNGSIATDLDDATSAVFAKPGNFLRYSSAYHDRIPGATLADLRPQSLAQPPEMRPEPESIEWTSRRILADGTAFAAMVDLPMATDNPRNHITARGDALIGRRVMLTGEVRPAPGCTSVLDVSQGKFALCHIPPDRRRIATFRAEAATGQPAQDGFTLLSVTWRSAQDNVKLAAMPIRRGVRADPEAAQWQVRNLRIEVQDALPVDAETQLVYVDIGARGGLPPQIARLGNLLHPVLVDADEGEANAVAARERTWFANVTAIPFGLADHDEMRTLHITQSVHCSSLLRPNTAVLSRYKLGHAFKTVREVSISCHRYDTLFAQGAAPMPDYLKIDVQGFEYQVLQGFGHLLDNVIGIELECHVYALYEGQKLLGDLVAFLDGRDFSLHGLQQQNARAVFDGETCEFNAWFLKRDHALPASPGIEKKLELCRSFIPRV